MPESGAITAEQRTAGQPDAQRVQLLESLEEAATIPGIDTTAIDTLREKLAARTFNLVVAGEFKRGKSSVINALLGAEVLPTGVVPLTSVVTLLHHGAIPSATAAFESGRRQTIGLDKLSDYVTERGNPRNDKHVKEVEVALPAPWLDHGIRLVDTPGIGSAHQHNSDITYAYLPQADAVIFVASVDQPVSRSELQFLADIRAHAGRVFCLLNKIDHLSETELAESVAFSTAALREALDAEVPVFPVSARLAIEAHCNGTPNGLARSGFAAFDAALRRFLRGDSAEVLARSVRRHLTRLLAACRLTAELELKALAAPLESLEEKLRAFDAKKAETLQQRSDFVALLEADARGLVKDNIEPAIAAFKHALTRRLDAQVPAWVHDAGIQHEVAPRAALERRSVDEVRRAFDQFHAQEDADAYAKFDRICARFRERIGKSADELMRYSAELFAIRFEAAAAEPLREARSHFYYKFWEEPDSLGLLAGALTDLLPRPLQGPFLLRRAHRRVAALVEMQSGRLRHDFEQRIMQAVRVERKQMLDRIEATIGAIEAAIVKGRALKSSGEETMAVRRREVATVMQKIDELETRAAMIA